MIPITVPSKPMYGALELIVASKDRFFESLSSSLLITTLTSLSVESIESAFFYYCMNHRL